MKFIKTGFEAKVHNGSSYVMYITKSEQQAMAVHRMAMTMKPMHDAVKGENDFFWQVHSHKLNGERDVMVPDFFCGANYWVTWIEHNNGNWKLEPTYELYIVED